MLTKNYQFRSERLRFRGITQEDAHIIVQWRNKPANYQNFLNAQPITLEGHLEWFNKYLDDDTRYDFIIMDKTDTPIGTAGISHIGSTSCEANYMIGDSSYRGNGYATETLKALVNLAFQELDVNEVVCSIKSDNAASIRVAEKNGFSEDYRMYSLEREKMRDMFKEQSA